MYRLEVKIVPLVRDHIHALPVVDLDRPEVKLSVTTEESDWSEVAMKMADMVNEVVGQAQEKFE